MRLSLSNLRAANSLLLIGLAVWIAGASCSMVGAGLSGIVLRCAALAVFCVVGVRRPSLLFWTFFAMLAGAEFGLDAPQWAVQTRFLGELFLRLIRMIVAPLLIATITTGIAGHGQLRSVGRVAVKAVVYFEVITTLGLLIGAVAMNLLGAGWGVALPAVQEPAPSGVPHGWQQILVNLFPENIAQAVAQNQILQVACFSILFGVALALLPEEKKAPLVTVLQALAETMFRMTRFIMFLAPVAAGAALASTVAGAGLATLLPLAKLVTCYYGALLVFALFVLLPSLVLFRVPLHGFLHAVSEPAVLGFATTSSEAALPLAMDRMEAFGVPRWIVSFVIPTGYSFNMTGASVYLSMAAVFCAQAGGIHLTVAQQIGILATLMLASKGVAGVPRAVLVVLMATASAVRLPVAPILLILGVDALMDMGRTAMNVVGNCAAAAIVAQTEHA
jgi:proton glutamate symport protein